MASDVKVDVQIDMPNIEGSLNSLLSNTELLTNIHEDLRKTIEPWTPYRTGDLANKVDVSASGVLYKVPYSEHMYYGEAKTKTVHPLATSHWDEVAMQTEMEGFEARVLELILQKAREYGW